MWDFLDYEQPLAPNASRYEGGTPNFIGASRLDRSIGGPGRGGRRRGSPQHVLALTDRLIEGLRARRRARSTRREAPGYSFRHRDVPACRARSGRAGTRLGEARIVTTFRPNGIRVSPHGYNTFDEIDALARGGR